MLSLMKEGDEVREDEDGNFSKFMKDNGVEVEFHETMSLSSANAVMSKLRFLLEPFRVVADENSSWEEKSAVKRLADKKEKYKRNKLWRKRKRRRVAENIAKVVEMYYSLPSGNSH